MRLLQIALFSAAALSAQQWELGVGGGYGVSPNVNTRSSFGKADVGFDHGPALTVYGAHNLYEHWSGELRYTYKSSDLRISGNGRKATMSGDIHTVHYDVLIHPSERTWRLLPFVAIGGGLRDYRGKGPETVSQPLGLIALLTKTTQVEPMISVGAGLRGSFGSHGVFRMEFRDYITPFPRDVIAPTFGDRPGWLHDFIPMVSIGARF